VDGSIATAAPFLPFSPSYAAFCASAFRVVTTSPPFWSLPLNMETVRSKKSRGSVPLRTPSSMLSSDVEPNTCEPYPVTGAHMGPSFQVCLYL
jgi:hypothetical protein